MGDDDQQEPDRWRRAWAKVSDAQDAEIRSLRAALAQAQADKEAAVAALDEIQAIAEGRDELCAYPRSAGERLRRLNEIAEVCSRARAALSGTGADPWPRGLPVRKVKGYPFPGVVVASYRTLSGDLRIIVECTEGAIGCQHIFAPEQLEPVTPAQEPGR